MKKNEIIELNGVEYTLELNRKSFIEIDKICNIDKTMKIIQSDLYEYVDEIGDDYDPTKNELTDEEIENSAIEKEKALHRIVERAFFIWMYPNHKLTISQVKEIVAPYLKDDEEKAKFIGTKIADYLQECINISEEYNKEQKNLKALANKN